MPSGDGHSASTCDASDSSWELGRTRLFPRTRISGVYPRCRAKAFLALQHKVRAVVNSSLLVMGCSLSYFRSISWSISPWRSVFPIASEHMRLQLWRGYSNLGFVGKVFEQKDDAPSTMSSLHGTCPLDPRVSQWLNSAGSISLMRVVGQVKVGCRINVMKEVIYNLVFSRLRSPFYSITSYAIIEFTLLQEGLTVEPLLVVGTHGMYCSESHLLLQESLSWLPWLLKCNFQFVSAGCPRFLCTLLSHAWSASLKFLNFGPWWATTGFNTGGEIVASLGSALSPACLFEGRSVMSLSSGLRFTPVFSGNISLWCSDFRESWWLANTVTRTRAGGDFRQSWRLLMVSQDSQSSVSPNTDCWRRCNPKLLRNGASPLTKRIGGLRYLSVPLHSSTTLIFMLVKCWDIMSNRYPPSKIHLTNPRCYCGGFFDNLINGYRFTFFQRWMLWFQDNCQVDFAFLANVSAWSRVPIPQCRGRCSQSFHLVFPRHDCWLGLDLTMFCAKTFCV